MPSPLFKNLVNRLWFASGGQSSSGFTLVELLISALIGSIIVSTLLTLVVNLLETDHQESAKSQRQQEMQAALSYISNDLRESVYIYPGECIQGRTDDPNTSDKNEFCPGIVNHIPNVENSVPVLAFWKLEFIPDNCKNSSGQLIAPCTDFDIAGRTYRLVVYYLRRNLQNDEWQGKARITRYELDHFDSGNPPKITPGYVNPAQANGTDFRVWPFALNQTGQLVNQQKELPNPTGVNHTLVDFVDLSRQANTNDSDNCSHLYSSSEYELTPSAATLTSKGLSGVRSFYACVRKPENGLNPDVYVRLRGNTHGVQGGYGKSSLLTLETHIQGRGTLDRSTN